MEQSIEKPWDYEDERSSQGSEDKNYIRKRPGILTINHWMISHEQVRYGPSQDPKLNCSPKYTNISHILSITIAHQPSMYDSRECLLNRAGAGGAGGATTPSSPP